MCHGCTHVHHLEPPSHLSPHIISLGHPSAPAPSILYPVSNLDWRFISYMIVYMFQCHSPKPSHHVPPHQSPKVHTINLCLFCCLTYRVIITIFLNSIYMHYCISADEWIRKLWYIYTMEYYSTIKKNTFVWVIPVPQPQASCILYRT